MQKSRYDVYVPLARAARARGLSYPAIDRELGLPNGKSWILLNRERHRENSRESWQRYYARGRRPLYED